MTEHLIYWVFAFRVAKGKPFAAFDDAQTARAVANKMNCYAWDSKHKEWL